MDRGSVDISDMPPLVGIKKTLRRLYDPIAEPNEAIARALETLARSEMMIRAHTTRLAPAA